MNCTTHHAHFGNAIQDITTDGVNVLWHLPPDEEEEEDAIVPNSVNWSGRSVVMTIKPGSCYSTNDVEPKLVWTTLGGGTDNAKVARCLVPLLSIQNVATFRETLDPTFEEEANMSRIEDDVCLFSITTDRGDVQVFEASTTRERDLLVAGLRNIIARMTFHAIVGDAGASSELYHDDVPPNDIPMRELPSMASPLRNMNRIAHALLD